MTRRFLALAFVLIASAPTIPAAAAGAPRDATAILAREADRTAESRLAPAPLPRIGDVPRGVRGVPSIADVLRQADEPGAVPVFAIIAAALDGLAWSLDRLPLVLAVLAGLLLLRSWSTPPPRGAGRTWRTVLAAIAAELAVTSCSVALLLGLAVSAGLLVGAIFGPALEVFVAYLRVALLYERLVVHAAWPWVLVALACSAALLALHVAIVVTASLGLLGRLQWILRRRLHDGVPLARHARLALAGLMSAAWAQVLPLLYVAAATPVIGWLLDRSLAKFVVERSAPERNWEFVLTSGAALYLVSFVLVFWLGRGVKALASLTRPGDDGAPLAAT
jgi:hypothetical protein